LREYANSRRNHGLTTIPIVSDRNRARGVLSLLRRDDDW
jgi:hypothetical protein